MKWIELPHTRVLARAFKTLLQPLQSRRSAKLHVTCYPFRVHWQNAQLGMLSVKWHCVGA